MRRIAVATTIAAPVETVWAHLVDTAEFPSWNPFITSLTGQLAVGERLTVRITPPGGKAMTFRPTVVAHEEHRRVEWLGRLRVPGLFDGRHSFTLTPTADGGTEFVQEEVFTGLLVPLTGAVLSKTSAGFTLMNEALRERAERVAA